MFGPKGVMFFMAAFVLCSILSSIVNIGWYGSEETEQIKWLTTIMDTGLNFGSLVTAAKSFFTQGLPALVTWDYSYLSGTSWGELTRFILFCVTSIGFVWSIIALTFPIMASAFGSLAGGVLRR